MTLLAARDLAVRIGDARPVTDASFAVTRGETLCLVGESGAGKTTACEALFGLSDGAATGTVVFDGEAAPADGGHADALGTRVGYVFQDARGSLNPVRRVIDSVAEAPRAAGSGRRDARSRAREALERVGAAGLADDYPHELSGGQTSRVALAAALAGDPDLLVLDEPTAGLDATSKRALWDLLDELRAERGLALLLVTHDLGAVAALGDRAAVMYAGEIVERGGVESLFDAPAHPYTRALLDAVPDEGLPVPIPGDHPSPEDRPAGCRFHPCCPHATDDCRSGSSPPLYEVSEADGTDGREASCVYYGPAHDAADLNTGETER